MGGGIAAVGAPGDELLETDRVWVYDLATGALMHELLPAPGTNLDEFGIVVSVTDTGAGTDPIVAVGAGRLIVSPTFLFQRTVELYNGRTGAHLASVLNADAGTGIAMGQEIHAYHDGTKGRLVVAANSSTVFAQPGANAYLFDITDPTNPTQIASFIGSDTVDADEFATAVATDGMTVAVTSPYRVGTGGELGAIYLFNADTGAEFGTLARPADLPASLDAFAPTIDIADGNVIYGTSAGTTYVQSTDGTVVASLNSPDSGSQGAFGFAVSVESAFGVINAAVSDPIAPVVGGTDAGPGEVYAFADVSGTGGPTCVPDLAEPFGSLNFFDLSAFITLFNASDPAADLAAPAGVFNFFDVSEYIALYNAGCP